MNGHGILTVEDLNTGKVLKQGDKTTLKFRLKDYDQETLSIVGKQVKVVLLTTDYKQKVEIATTTVGADDIVSFSISVDLLPRKYYMEFVVDDKYIFPSEHRYYWRITPSSLNADVNIIQMYGVDDLVNKVVPLVEKASAQEVANIVKPQVIPTIDTDGTWKIGGVDTNKPSRGIQGPIGPQGLKGDPGEVTKAQLDAGLADVESDLDMQVESINKAMNDLAFSQVNLNYGKITMGMLAEEVIQAIAGAAQVNGIVANGSLTTEKYADKSVSESKTSFYKKYENNLYSPDKLMLNLLVSEQGDFQPLNGYSTIKLNVFPGKNYYVSSIYRYMSVAFFNDTTFISKLEKGSDGSYTFVAPQNANIAYIRVANSQLNKLAIFEGDKPKQYQDGRDGEIPNLYISSDNIKNKIVLSQLEDVEFNNLLDLSKLELNSFLKDDGRIISTPNLSISEKIRVNEGDILYFNANYLETGGYYDANGNWLAPIEKTYDAETKISTITVPKYVSMVRFNVWNEGRENLKITNSIELANNLADTGRWMRFKRNKSVEQSRFFGETWLVTGDSITEKNSRATKNWHDFLKDWFGLSEVINDGKSGTGLVKTYAEHKNIIDRIDSWPTTGIDRILIMGAMNDLQSGETADTELGLQVGTMSDSQDTVTVYGAMKKLFNKLYAKYPNVPIIFMSSTPRINNHGNSDKFKQYLKAYKEVCEDYNVPFIDLYSQSSLRPWLPENNKKYFSSPNSPNGDGVHPNADGQRVIAYQVKTLIEMY